MRLVLAAFLVIISVFVPIVQWNKNHTICSFLKKAAIKGLGLHEGGTKEVRQDAHTHVPVCFCVGV